MLSLNIRVMHDKSPSDFSDLFLNIEKYENSITPKRQSIALTVG